MSKRATYGSHAEIQAAVEFYNCRLVVFHDLKVYAEIGESGAEMKGFLKLSGGLENGHFDVYIQAKEQELLDISFSISSEEHLSESGENVEKGKKRRKRFSNFTREKQKKESATKNLEQKSEKSPKADDSCTMLSQPASKHQQKNPEQHRKSVSVHYAKTRERELLKWTKMKSR